MADSEKHYGRACREVTEEYGKDSSVYAGRVRGELRDEGETIGLNRAVDSYGTPVSAA